MAITKCRIWVTPCDAHHGFHTNLRLKSEGLVTGREAMNTRQSSIILFTLLAVSVGAFSQATARGLTDESQPVVEATTKAAASGAFDFDGTPQLKPPPQKPTTWWEWLRFVGGGR